MYSNSKAKWGPFQVLNILYLFYFIVTFTRTEVYLENRFTKNNAFERRTRRNTIWETSCREAKEKYRISKERYNWICGSGKNYA